MGGTGSRLHPITLATSKHGAGLRQADGDTTPCSTLMLAGIRDILVITTPTDVEHSAGSWDMVTSWIRSPMLSRRRLMGLSRLHPRQAAHRRGNCCFLIIGDNIFYGARVGTHLRRLSTFTRRNHFRLPCPRSAHIRRSRSRRMPSRAVPGGKAERSSLALRRSRVVFLRQPPRSRSPRITAIPRRGDNETTDVNPRNPERGQLSVEGRPPRGTGVLDTRKVFDFPAGCRQLHKTIEQRQGLRSVIPEEVAWPCGFLQHDSIGRAHSRSLIGPPHLIPAKDLLGPGATAKPGRE